MHRFFVVLFLHINKKRCVAPHCLRQFPDIPDIVIFSWRGAVAHFFDSIHINATDHFCSVIVAKQKVEEDNRRIRDCVLPGNTACTNS